MDPFWIFAIICIGMMIYFMFFTKDSEHGGMCCMPHTTHNTREQNLEKEIETLKEEINQLKKVKH